MGRPERAGDDVMVADVADETGRQSPRVRAVPLGLLDDGRGALVLALFYGLGAVGSLAGAASPMSPQAPVGLDQVVAAIAAVVAVTLVLYRRRIDNIALQFVLGGGSVLLSIVVACSKTAAGVTVLGLNYVWVALFAGYFFARKSARLQVAAGVAGFSAGALADGVPKLAVPWFCVVAAAIAGSEVLAHLVSMLRTQAATDSLTGLANRASFRARVEREIALSARTGTPLVLALLDLDHFKAVNDNQGHVAGDALLVDLSVAWQSQLAERDLLSRYGGDEFALLLPASTIEQARALIERLRAVRSTAWSAGIAIWSPGSSTGRVDADIDALFQLADEELYRAKSSRADRARSSKR